MIVAVIPTYNERKNIAPLFARLMPFVDFVVIVDDGSPDGTAKETSKYRQDGVLTVERQGKLGLGSAYVEGIFTAVMKFDPDVLITMDADLQHPPEDVPKLVDAIKHGADMAIASRYVKGGRTGFGLKRGIVSSGANALARFALGLPAKDCTTAFRTFSRRAASILCKSAFSSSGFSYEVEVLKLMKDRGMKVVEVPSAFGIRVNGESKLTRKEVLSFIGTVVRLSLTLSNRKDGYEAVG